MCTQSPSLSTHFRLLALSKYELTEVEKAKIQDVAFHYLGILYFLAYPKCDLGEFDKAMLHVVDGPFGHTFRLLSIRKYDFNKVEKAVIQWVAWL